MNNHKAVQKNIRGHRADKIIFSAAYYQMCGRVYLEYLVPVLGKQEKVNIMCFPFGKEYFFNIK